MVVLPSEVDSITISWKNDDHRPLVIQQAVFSPLILLSDSKDKFVYLIELTAPTFVDDQNPSVYSIDELNLSDASRKAFRLHDDLFQGVTHTFYEDPNSDQCAYDNSGLFIKILKSDSKTYLYKSEVFGMKLSHHKEIGYVAMESRPKDCSINNGDCEQVCEQASPDVERRCSCFEGYSMVTDVSNQYNHCEDINECSLPNHGCVLGCENMIGSYTCKCPPNMELSAGKCRLKQEFCSPLNECSYECQKINGKEICVCPPGSKLKADGKTCQGCSVFGKGGCSHQCIISSKNSWACSCNTGYILQNDGKACLVDDTQRPLVYFHDEGKINIAFETGSYFQIQDTPLIGNTRRRNYPPSNNLQYDAVTETLYYSQGKSIFRYRKEQSSLFFKHRFQITALTLDWINRDIYFADNKAKIYKIKTDVYGHNEEILFIKSEKPVKVNALAVYPEIKRIFIASQDGLRNHGIGEESEMSIIYSESAVNGLAIDFVEKKLYWTTENNVLYSNFDGGDLISLKDLNFEIEDDKSKIFESPFGVAVFEDFVWLTDPIRNQLTRLDKRDKTEIKSQTLVDYWNGRKLFSSFFEELFCNFVCEKII